MVTTQHDFLQPWTEPVTEGMSETTYKKMKARKKREDMIDEAVRNVYFPKTRWTPRGLVTPIDIQDIRAEYNRLAAQNS